MVESRPVRLALRNRAVWRAQDSQPSGALVLEALPGLAGANTVGSVITATPGEYLSPSAVSLEGQFQRNGSPIAGAETYSYTLIAADEGALITFREVATNALGSLAVVSNAIGPVAALAVAPTALAAPSISDTTPTEGQTLTFTHGSYSGTQPIALAWQLQRETAPSSGTYADLAGATGAAANLTTWVVTAASVGLRLRLREVASNVAGSAANNFSAATSAVAAATPGPLVADQSFSIDETAGIGAVVGTMANTGGVAGSWSITSGNTGGAFAISGTGVLTVAAPLDYETTASYALGITAANEAASDTATATIDINDVAETVGVLHTAVLDGTSQAGAARHYTFGQAFPEGALMPADDYSLRNASTLAPLPTQIDVLSTWADGSVKHAHITATATLAEGARLACEAVKGAAGASGADVNMATLLSGRTLSLTITPATGTAWTQNLYASLPAERWLLGPLCAEARAEFDVPAGNFTGAAGLRVVADITAFSNGDVRVFLQLANDKTLVAGAGRPAYAATVTMDGNTVWSFASQTHAQYTALVKEFGTTSAGAVLPERPFAFPDMAYAAQSGLVEAVDAAFTLDASVSSGLATILGSATYNTLKDRRGINASLGASGDAGQIGWFTQSQAAWLASNGTMLNAARVMRGWAESTPALWPHRYWADDVGQWLLPSFAPLITSWSGRTSAAGTAWATAQGLPSDQKKEANTYVVAADHGHQGPWYFLPWMIEARRFYADGVAAQASWSWLDPNLRYLGYRTPNYDTGEGLGYAWTAGSFTVETQARSCGHDFRAIVNAAKALPNAYPGRAAHIDLARGQMAWINTMRTVFENSLTASYGAGNWEALGALPFVSAVIGHAPYREANPGWQHDFIRKAAVDHCRAKLPGHDSYARAALDWLMTWHTQAINRTTGTWNWKNAFKQITWAAAPNQQRFATLDEMQAGLVAVGQDAGATWAGAAYGGSGDYMRRFLGMALDYLALPNPNPLMADALHRLISERGNDSDQAGMPGIYDVNLTAQPRTLVTRPGTRRSFAVAPAGRAGQVFSMAGSAAAGTALGVVLTDGGLPRATTENGTDAMAITSGADAALFTISSGGVLRRSASGTATAGAKVLGITPRNGAGVGSEFSITVNVT